METHSINTHELILFRHDVYECRDRGRRTHPCGERPSCLSVGPTAKSRADRAADEEGCYTARQSRNQKAGKPILAGISAEDNVFARRATNLTISSIEAIETAAEFRIAGGLGCVDDPPKLFQRIITAA